jgi:hypothetical protein
MPSRRTARVSERFIFIGIDSPDPIGLEDWTGRGITPIPYKSANGHSALSATLDRWAQLSAINGQQRLVDAAVRRIVKAIRTTSIDSERDLFDHLVRRSNVNERARLSALASRHGADMGWLDAIAAIMSEPDVERRR